MVDTWHSVGGRGTFVKNKRGATLTFFYTTLKEPLSIPLLKHLLIDVRKVKPVVFSEFMFHWYIFFARRHFESAKIMVFSWQCKFEGADE